MQTKLHPAAAPALRALLTLARYYFDPIYLGLDQLDLRRPALLVGNHTLYGLTDAPLMIDHLYRAHGVRLRALADRAHFRLPLWSDMFSGFGAVLGTPENCSALMRSGESILVFPGGAREVFRRKGEAYQLIWKNRSGFARLAIEHGYDIIPFGSVGPDESYRILLDADEMMHTRPWQWLGRHSNIEQLLQHGDFLPPLARGIGLSVVPRAQRYYFGFGPRIETTALQGMQHNEQLVWTLREQVQAAVELQIAQLLRYRVTDRSHNWPWWRRLLS